MECGIVGFGLCVDFELWGLREVGLVLVKLYRLRRREGLVFREN